ncbi:DUF11 domain-containing protein [Vibrio sp. ArtGut-C1]|uniref:DUF11 domain-containing protein n=1 Tax=Vibrio sp. ArtGut-C1 TaxID=2259137 RepID=UPI000A19163A|nr:DUF11 domain-containing protein [Vibrio sp. ArtGut-C1]
MIKINRRENSNTSFLRFFLLVNLFFISVIFSAYTLAFTPAGTEINNRATVIYQDANGNTYTAQSNESTVVVAEVYAATLAQDRISNASPGTTVYFPHTLTNTGNAVDTFSISSLNDNSGEIYQVYEDVNGNGLVDAGEVSVNQITLSASERVQLIVSVPVPSNAVANSVIDLTITATSLGGGAGIVEDIGSNSDGLNDTNNDKINVTNDAVLVATKTASPNYSTNEINYTLQVVNNGNRSAKNVDIYDAIPNGASFVRIDSINGLLPSNGDLWDDNGTLTLLPHSYSLGNISIIDEPPGVDMNGNGIPGESGVDGIKFRDVELPANTTISINFTVQFDPTLEAGTLIKNVFVVEGDTDGDGNPDGPEESNEVTTEVLQTFSVIAEDTGDIANGDDDNALNDIAYISESSAGSSVAFSNVIRNNGNGSDTFDLSIINDGGVSYTGLATLPAGSKPFPAGTVFTFWNSTNSTQLTDTNGNGIPDTGSLPTGGDRQITVRAILPANASGLGPYVATTLATSSGDENVKDDKLEILGSIIEPNIDLANSFSGDLINGSVNADTFDPLNPIQTKEAAPGGSVTFSLFAANNAGNSQSFNLAAELPNGWSVTFRELGIDTNSDGVIDNSSNAGSIITSSPNLPGGSVYLYEAVVQISSVSGQADSDFIGSINGLDGVDGNADGDKDYPIKFTIISSATGAYDEKLDAVDVVAERKISVTPDGANQIQPGGTVDYSHVISNQGNTIESLEIIRENSRSDEGWNNNTFFFDITANAWININSIATGSVDLRSPDGSVVTVEIDNTGPNPLLTLEPGEKIDVLVTVFAPSSASQGDKDLFTLSAGNTLVSDSATDITEVVTGQVRLSKAAAIDKSCNCESGNWPAPSLFSVEPADKVAPSECVVWALNAINQGTTNAENVVITDEVTEFTSYVASDSSIRASDGNTTSNTGVLPSVEWKVGILSPGDSARAQFCVKVD